jgi:hypothetical protein
MHYLLKFNVTEYSWLYLDDTLVVNERLPLAVSSTFCGDKLPSSL